MKNYIELYLYLLILYTRQVYLCYNQEIQVKCSKCQHFPFKFVVVLCSRLPSFGMLVKYICLAENMNCILLLSCYFSCFYFYQFVITHIIFRLFTNVYFLNKKVKLFRWFWHNLRTEIDGL